MHEYNVEGDVGLPRLIGAARSAVGTNNGGERRGQLGAKERRLKEWIPEPRSAPIVPPSTCLLDQCATGPRPSPCGNTNTGATGAGGLLYAAGHREIMAIPPQLAQTIKGRGGLKDSSFNQTICYCPGPIGVGTIKENYKFTTLPKSQGTRTPIRLPMLSHINVFREPIKT
ncbi:hypothetical protein EYF80_028177 [Liparis tanakae]|uniref:Uncharacterized protein n=1 Tax=Liparis tanakae TaxID=230148 RepID=A0A4Z2H8I6_9TELE|nr:hypothetical protein EYF80_028177 [Liparis tanakae]